MQNKLLIITMMAVIGIVGCSKEDETAAINPTVDQAQPAATTTVQTQPVQAQTNVQSQEQLPVTTVSQQPSEAQASPMVTVTNDAQSQIQPLPTAAPSTAPQTVGGNLQVGQEQLPSAPRTVDANSGNLTPPPAAAATIAPVTATTVPAVTVPAETQIKEATSNVVEQIKK